MVLETLVFSPFNAAGSLRKFYYNNSVVPIHLMICRHTTHKTLYHTNKLCNITIDYVNRYYVPDT
jgi:hypothetical protein